MLLIWWIVIIILAKLGFIPTFLVLLPLAIFIVAFMFNMCYNSDSSGSPDYKRMQCDRDGNRPMTLEERLDQIEDDIKGIRV